MNRDELLKVAGEPVGFRYEVLAQWGETESWRKCFGEFEPVASEYIRNVEPLYTEAQLLAMYTAGAADMKERADDAWADAIQSDCEHGVKWLSERVAEQLHKEYPALARLGETIRALPITPTNTEGEQG